jgi:hypothetical protein
MGSGEQSYQCGYLSVWNVVSWSVVRCIVQYVVFLVSVGNVFCSGSSSQRQDSKRTAVHAPKQCLLSARPKLSAANSTQYGERTPSHMSLIDAVYFLKSVKKS